MSVVRRTVIFMRFCRCCGLDNAIFSARKSPDGLPTAAICCDLCAKHQGSHESSMRKALKVHREMWEEHERERVENLIESHDTVLAARDAKIAELENELEERPVQVVEKWVDADELHKAHEQATAAYRSRDHALRQLAMIHMDHHELPGERCKCGKNIAGCEVVGIVEGYRLLLRWERRQEERMDQGLSHQLPREYVKRLGKRFDGYDEFEFDPYEHETGS